MCSPNILFLVPLLFAPSIPTYLLNFKFLNHSSLFAFYTAKDSYKSSGRHSKYYRRLLNNYACLQALVNNTFTWKSSCVIAKMLEKQQKLFVYGYYLEVHNVIKYTRKHCATVIISHASRFYLCDIISRSCSRLSSPSKVRFTPC